MEIFTYEWLRELYGKAKGIAPIVPVHEWKGQRAIILGHDIDYSMRKAYDLYLLEKEMDVRSTFFVLTTSPCYNILDLENRKRFGDMIQSGYEIGLHFDVSVYQDQSYDHLRVEAVKEAAILKQIVGKSMRSICLHNPGTVGVFPSFPEFINTCDFWNGIPVLVDSCMDFKGVDPFDFIEKAFEGPIALWLHPIHYGFSRPKYYDVLAYDVLGLMNRIDSIGKANLTYRKQIGELSLALKIKERIL